MDDRNSGIWPFCWIISNPIRLYRFCCFCLLTGRGFAHQHVIGCAELPSTLCRSGVESEKIISAGGIAQQQQRRSHEARAVADQAVERTGGDGRIDSRTFLPGQGDRQLIVHRLDDAPGGKIIGWNG